VGKGAVFCNVAEGLTVRGHVAGKCLLKDGSEGSGFVSHLS